MLSGLTILIGGGDADLRQHCAARCEALGALALVACTANADDASRPAAIVWGENEAAELAQVLARRHAAVAAAIILPTASPGGALDRQADNEWAAALRANLRLRFLITRAVTPGCVERRSGAIVHLLPAGGFMGQGDGATESTLGLATIGFSRSAALDLAPFSVRSNCAVATPGDEGIELACFLASSAASAFNGQVLVADGTGLHLSSQPRPTRILHRHDGWRAEEIAISIGRNWAGALVPHGETLFDVI